MSKIPPGYLCPELFTPKEHKAIELVAAGLKGEEVAREMGVSPSTHRQRMEGIYAKLVRIGERGRKGVKGMKGLRRELMVLAKSQTSSPSS